MIDNDARSNSSDPPPENYTHADLLQTVEYRYGDRLSAKADDQLFGRLTTMLQRGSCRVFKSDPIDATLCTMLCAAALAAPTKSDLQQRDIVLLRDPHIMAQFCDLIGTEAWAAKAPNIAVFCGNNRRQRQLHDIQNHPFANDHLDAFFNATVDAAMALSAFVTAAETIGLGCCPISAVRNEAAAVSRLLNLPDHVFPVAGLAFGYPVATTPEISLRLPLSATVHLDQYSELESEALIRRYDTRRRERQPYPTQRRCDLFGTADTYGWAEDKARQYALPERTNFGAFIRERGFRLE